MAAKKPVTDQTIQENSLAAAEAIRVMDKIMYSEYTKNPAEKLAEYLSTDEVKVDSVKVIRSPLPPEKD